MADWGPFVKGLAGTLPQIGFQTYALRQRDEALAREEARLQEKVKQDEVIKDWKIGGQLLSVMSNKNLPKQMRSQAYNNLRPIWEKNGLGSMPEMESWDDTFSDVAKKAYNVYADEKMDLPTKVKAIKGLYAEAQDEHERKTIAEYEKSTIREGVSKVPKDEQGPYLAQLPESERKALSPEAEKKPDMVKQYEYAQGQGYKGSFVQFKKELRAAQGGGDVAAQTLKNEKFVNALEKQADSEAAREARMKYNTQPTLQQGPDGKIVMSFPNSPEAHQFYLSRKKELTDKKITRAVEKKALPKEYKVEPTEVPKPQSATPIDTEEGLRTYLKSAGADEKYINDYVKRAKEQKKIK